MLISKHVTPVVPTPIERKSSRKAIVLDDRWMLYAFPVVWFLVLIAIAALIWVFQLYVVPFFS